jgi:hypothetical protein
MFCETFKKLSGNNPYSFTSFTKKIAKNFIERIDSSITSITRNVEKNFVERIDSSITSITRKDEKKTLLK